MAISPMGGRLVDRLEPLSGEPLEKRLKGLPTLHLTVAERCDLLLIAVGGMSPLEGFMGEADYESTVESARLDSGHLFGLPVTLAARAIDVTPLRVGAEAALIGPDGEALGVIEVSDVYYAKPEWEAACVYGTTETAHPGVAGLYARPNVRVGGRITLFQRPPRRYPEELTPLEVRQAIEERGWRTVVAFQTRNPVHRAHEYLQKCALEVVDGLLLHPLVGQTKKDDVPDPIRMESYRAVLRNYYPAERTLLAAYPGAMRYAGPREALNHAVVRRNYGASHFVVGRDHAGVGGYYPPLAAQEYLASLPQEDLGIIPLRFSPAFFCKRCGQMATAKTCPHPDEDHVVLSGTQVRAMLRRGETPPPQYSRPEVAEILAKAMSQTAAETTTAR